MASNTGPVQPKYVTFPPVGGQALPTQVYRRLTYGRSSVAITEKIYVKNHRQIGAQLDTQIPRGAFNGATLDILYQGEGLADLNSATRDRVLAFAEDFLDCGCETNPYCGHPERKFVRYLLECREQGLAPGAIVDQMEAEYMVYAYEGDILSFLDDAARTLEAIESIADVEGAEAVESAARRRRQALVD